MRERGPEIFRRAVEPAGSGKCKDWYDVRERLVEKGYRRAPDLLDGEKIRTILDFQCGIGRKQGKTTWRNLPADIFNYLRAVSLTSDTRLSN